MSAGICHWFPRFLLVGSVIAFSGCFGPKDDAPAPPLPEPPSPPATDDVDGQLEPSIEHLKVNRVIRKWGRDPDVAWSTTITLAHMSKLAYDEVPPTSGPLDDLGFATIRPLKRGSHAGFVAATDEVGVIAFRGTNQTEILDWITNVNIRLLADLESGRKLHAGFQGAYDGFKDEIDAVLGQQNPKRVWITGHSLGGAMAACCAYDRQMRGKPVAGVVTFGQPRIGNESLADYLDSELGDRYLRLMNEGDPVPILPPCFGKVFPAYWHSGRRGWFLWGQLYTTQGPQVAAQTGPEEERQDSSPVFGGPVGQDAFRSMTEQDFEELQRQLKAMQHSDVPLASVTEDEAPLRAQSFGGVLAQFIMDRIGEHDMDEYLRKLNERYKRINGQ